MSIKKLIWSLILGSVVVSSSIRADNAQVFVTPPAPIGRVNGVDYGSTLLTCAMTNNHPIRNIVVELRVFDLDGATLDTKYITLPARNTNGIQNARSGAAWCQASVVSGPAKFLNLNAVYSENGEYTTTLPSQQQITR